MERLDSDDILEIIIGELRHKFRWFNDYWIVQRDSVKLEFEKEVIKQLNKKAEKLL